MYCCGTPARIDLWFVFSLNGMLLACAAVTTGLHFGKIATYVCNVRNTSNIIIIVYDTWHPSASNLASWSMSELQPRHLTTQGHKTETVAGTQRIQRIQRSDHKSGNVPHLGQTDRPSVPTW